MSINQKIEGKYGEKKIIPYIKKESKQIELNLEGNFLVKLLRWQGLCGYNVLVTGRCLSYMDLSLPAAQPGGHSQPGVPQPASLVHCDALWPSVRKCWCNLVIMDDNRQINMIY